MAPNESTPESQVLKNSSVTKKKVFSRKESTEKNKKNSILQSFEDYFEFKTPLVWLHIIGLVIHQLLGITWTIIWIYQGKLISKFRTTLFIWFVAWIGGFGVTGGAHRYWTHRSYKAKLPLKIILMLCYCVSGENSLFDWVRDHRVHHRFSETDADPHNAKRGFFFAHIGWLMMKKHPEVLEKGRQVDMTDILEDPVIKFHQKYFQLLRILCSYVIPTMIPVYLWNEEWKWALISQLLIRYVFVLNSTWLVNSLAHIHGAKPYDKRISPVESKIVSFMAMGEGWHNYHHTFPWDYKTSELGNYSFNVTTMFIEMFAKIGWAYDLRYPSKSSIENMKINYGDGSLNTAK